MSLFLDEIFYSGNWKFRYAAKIADWETTLNSQTARFSNFPVSNWPQASNCPKCGQCYIKRRSSSFTFAGNPVRDQIHIM
ncbi:unnamed protein product [Calypogeia fissa]